MKKIIIYSLLLFMQYSNLKAQISDSFFCDTEQKGAFSIKSHLKFENSIIIAGNTFDITKGKPAIIRIDTLGNTIWNTAFTDTSVYICESNHTSIFENYYVDKLLLASDNYLYATFYNAHDGYNVNKRIEFWKIDPINGLILWKHSYSYGSLPVSGILDYDSTKFLATYILSNFIKFAFVSKFNGDTLNSYKIGNSIYSDFSICIDNNKDIYYSNSDSIFKVNGVNPNNKIWRKKQQYYASCAYYDTTTSSVFFLGKGRYILKLNPSDGTQLSLFETQVSGTDYIDQYLGDMKVKDGFMYISWKYNNTGDGRLRTTKLNMVTNSTIWDLFYTPSNGYTLSNVSLDLDNNGDVFLTGHGYISALWHIQKVNGLNGDTMFFKIISSDSASNMFSGVASYVINNQPYFLGLFSTIGDNFHPNHHRKTFIKVNSLTGNISIMKFIEGNYQFPSKTICIKNYPPSKTLVLKQMGRFLILEMYNYDKQLLWSKNLRKSYVGSGINYITSGNKIAISPCGDIYVSAMIRNDSCHIPYYTESYNLIVIFQLNNSGNVINEYSGGSCGIINELYVDNSGVQFFKNVSGDYYYFKFLTTSSLTSINTGIKYNNFQNTKYCFNKNSAYALIFGKSNYQTKMLKINKINMSITNMSTLTSPLDKISYVYEIDTNLVVLCAANSLNQESVGLYRTDTKTSVWAKKLSDNSGSVVIKCVTDLSKQYLYTISSNLSNIVVRKLNMVNGNQEWEYTFNGVENNDDYPVDISYDKFRKQILITGYETQNDNKQVLTLIIDTAGIAQDTINKIGDNVGDNTGLCTHTLYDGSQWVGGNINKYPYKKAGFLSEIYGTFGDVYQSEEICLVSVDPTIGKNKIFYDKTQGVGISEYHIYKETNPNVYNQIQSIPFSATSVFTDNNSNPELHTDKYKISVVDSSGNESFQCAYHKSIKLSLEVVDSTMKLSWDDYIDESGQFIPDKFYIYRDSTANTITLYDSVPDYIHNYNDINIHRPYYYIIGVKKINGCNDNYSNISFSNRKLNFSNKLSEIKYESNLIIYPNPNNGKFTIEFENLNKKNVTIIITDLTGKKIFEANSIEEKFDFKESRLRAGIYLVKVITDKIINRKIFVQD